MPHNDPHPAIQALIASASYPNPEQLAFIARQPLSKRRKSTYQVEARNDVLKVRLTVDGAGYADIKASSENIALHGKRAAKTNDYHDVVLAHDDRAFKINTGLGIEHTEKSLAPADIMIALFSSIDKMTHAYCAGGYDGWLMQTRHHLQRIARERGYSLEMTSLLPIPKSIGTIGLKQYPEHEIHILHKDDTVETYHFQDNEREAQQKIDRACRPTGCRLKFILPITMIRMPYQETITVHP